MNMVDFEIRITPSKSEFCLICGMPMGRPKQVYKVILERTSIFIHKVKVSPGILLGYVNTLEKSLVKYSIDRMLCKSYSLSKGSHSFFTT